MFSFNHQSLKSVHLRSGILLFLVTHGMFWIGGLIVSYPALADPVILQDPEYGPQIDPSQRAELISPEIDFHIKRAAVSNSGDRWLLVVEKGESPYTVGAPERYEVLVWEPAANFKTHIATIKSDALPHISHPVWSPDDKQVAWATIPEKRVTPDEIDPRTGIISEVAEKAHREWSKRRGSKITVFSLEREDSFSVDFPVEVRELAWGTASYLFACGYQMGERHGGSPEELWLVDLSQDNTQPQYVFSPPKNDSREVYHLSLLLGHDISGAVYFGVHVGLVNLLIGNAISLGATEGKRWTIYKTEIRDTEIVTLPVTSWEAETDNLLITPRCISPNGKWLACEATAPSLKGIGLALFSVEQQQPVLIPNEKLVQPIAWSPDGGYLYALIPDTINARPFGKIPRFAARYSFASLFR